MFRGQKKRKPNKDKRQFNGTAVNHTESALWRETHRHKKKRTQRTKEATLYQKSTCEHYQAGYPFNNSSFLDHVSSVHISKQGTDT